MNGRRKRLPLLLLVGLMAVALLQLSPAQAGGVKQADTGGLPPTSPGVALVPPKMDPAKPGCGDALDPVLTQSRWAPVYQDRTLPTYTKVLDIKDWSFSAVNPWIWASVTLCGPAPTHYTHIPPGYSELTYFWLFKSPRQQNAFVLQGYECFPERYNDLGPTTDNRISLFRYPRTSTCPKAANPQGEIQQVASGTAPADIDAVERIPRHTENHFWLQVSLSFSIEVVGTTPVLRPRWQWGWYDENAQTYFSFDGFNNNNAPGALDGAELMGRRYDPVTNTLVIDPNAMTIRVPYTPRIDAGVDDDLLIDEQRTWPLAKTGDPISGVVLSAFGTRTVGLPVPVCPFGPQYPSPGGPLPGYPQNLPGADGGRFCRKDFVGLLSGHDWAPNLGFEGRAVARSPSWAPSPNISSNNWWQCRNLLGGAPLLGTPAVGAGPYDVSADQDAFWVEVRYNTTQFGPSVLVPGANGPDLTIPLATGQNIPCNYQRVPTGLHYYIQANTALVAG